MRESRQESMAIIEEQLNPQEEEYRETSTPEEETPVETPHAAPQVPGQEENKPNAEKKIKRPGAQTALDWSKARIASLPDPGGIAFPLIVLLIFFFILIAINGHTRIQWLWLVLTGNAHLSGESLPTQSTGSTTTQETPQQIAPSQVVANLPSTTSTQTIAPITYTYMPPGYETI